MELLGDRVPFHLVVEGEGGLGLSLAPDLSSCSPIVREDVAMPLNHPTLAVVRQGDRLEQANGVAVMCPCCTFDYDTGECAIDWQILLHALQTRPTFRSVWTSGVAPSLSVTDDELIAAIVKAYDTDGNGELNDAEITGFLATLLEAAMCDVDAMPRPLALLFSRSRFSEPPLEEGRECVTIVVGAESELGLELHVDPVECTAVVATVPTGATHNADVEGTIHVGDRLDWANEHPFLSSTAHFDEDGDFRIDATELKNALTSHPEFRRVFTDASAALATASHDELVATILAVYDEDHSGDLNDEEVVKFLQTLLNAARAQLYSLPRPLTLRFSRRSAAHPASVAAAEADEHAASVRALASWTWRSEDEDGMMGSVGAEHNPDRRPFIREAIKMGMLEKEHRQKILGKSRRDQRFFILAANAPLPGSGAVGAVLLTWTKSKAHACAAFPELAIELSDEDRYTMQKLQRKGKDNVKITTKLLGPPHVCEVNTHAKCDLMLTGGEPSGSQKSTFLNVRATSNIARDSWRDALELALQPAVLAPLSPRSAAAAASSGDTDVRARSEKKSKQKRGAFDAVHDSAAASLTMSAQVSPPPAELLRTIDGLEPVRRVSPNHPAAWPAAAASGSAGGSGGGVAGQEDLVAAAMSDEMSVVIEVRVTLLEAKNLGLASGRSSSDPYVRIIWRSSATQPWIDSGFATKSVGETQNPKWGGDDSAEYILKIRRKDIVSRLIGDDSAAAGDVTALHIKLEVVDKGAVANGDSLGHVDIELSQREPCISGWQPIEGGGGGELLLQIDANAWRSSADMITTTTAAGGGVAAGGANAEAVVKETATTTTQPVAVKTVMGTAEKVEQLQALREVSAITQEEFDTQIAAIRREEIHALKNAGAIAAKNTTDAVAASSPKARQTKGKKGKGKGRGRRRKSAYAAKRDRADAAKAMGGKHEKEDDNDDSFDTTTSDDDDDHGDAPFILSSNPPPRWYVELRDENAISEAAGRASAEVSAATNAVTSLLRELREKCADPLEYYPDHLLDLGVSTSTSTGVGAGMDASSSGPLLNTVGSALVTVSGAPSELRTSTTLLLEHLEKPQRHERTHRIDAIGYVPDPWLPSDGERMERDGRRARLHRLRLRQNALLEEMDSSSWRTLTTGSTSLRSPEGSPAKSLPLTLGGHSLEEKQKPPAGRRAAARARSPGEYRDEVKLWRGETDGEEDPLNPSSSRAQRKPQYALPPNQPSRTRDRRFDAVNSELGAAITAEQWGLVGRLEQPAPTASVAERHEAAVFGGDANSAASEAEMNEWIAAEIAILEHDRNFGSGRGGGGGGGGALPPVGGDEYGKDEEAALTAELARELEAMGLRRDPILQREIERLGVRSEKEARVADALRSLGGVR